MDQKRFFSAEKSVDLTAAGEVDGALLHIGDHVKAAAGTLCHAGDGVVRHGGGDAGALLDQLPTAFSLWNMETVLEPLRQMIMLRPAQSLNQRLLVQSYACQILSALSHYRQADEAAVRSVAKHRAALIHVGCYIRENLAGDLCREMLAKQCNMAPNYFHRIFKAAFGRSPAKLVEQYRIDDAKRELVSSDLPLDELAAKCGFSSQSYFCSRFKKVTGKTPVQYRDEILSRLDQDSGI